MEVSEAYQVVNIPPSMILSDDNIRFGLKPQRVEDLMGEIEEQGGVHTPLFVEVLAEPANGFEYKMDDGHYRQAAVVALAKKGKEFPLPCIVRPTSTDSLERMKLQLSANMDRQELSPMDIAVAAKKLLDAGVPRLDIRKIFSRPGRAKGGKKAPCSNAYINMVVSFLQFPKPIQTKIHLGPDLGGIGISAAYELTKVSREKWDTVLAGAEEDRKATIAREEKDETKYLEAESKRVEAEKKAHDLSEQLTKDKAALQAKSAELDKLNDEAAGLYAQVKKAKPTNAEDAAEVKAAQDRLKELEAASKEKVKEVTELTKAVEKVESSAEKAQKLAQERADKLKEIRLKAAKDPAKKKKEGPSAEDVKKAAAKAGAGTGFVPLNAADMRTVIHDWTLPGSMPKIAAIAEIIKRVFSGEITEKQGYNEIAYSITKELKDKPKHMK